MEEPEVLFTVTNPRILFQIGKANSQRQGGYSHHFVTYYACCLFLLSEPKAKERILFDETMNQEVVGVSLTLENPWHFIHHLLVILIIEQVTSLKGYLEWVVTAATSAILAPTLYLDLGTYYKEGKQAN